MITTQANSISTTTSTVGWLQTTLPAVQYYPVPYYQTVTLEAPVSKTDTALKVINALIEEGIIDGEKLAVKDLLALVTKLVEDVL